MIAVVLFLVVATLGVIAGPRFPVAEVEGLVLVVHPHGSVVEPRLLVVVDDAIDHAA